MTNKMNFLATGRRMNTIINLYIGNLAIADVIIAIFCIPFQFQAAILQRWDLPDFMCKLCPFIQVFLSLFHDKRKFWQFTWKIEDKSNNQVKDFLFLQQKIKFHKLYYHVETYWFNVYKNPWFSHKKSGWCEKVFVTWELMKLAISIFWSNNKTFWKWFSICIFSM